MSCPLVGKLALCPCTVECVAVRLHDLVSPMETAEGAAGMVVTAVDVVDAANDNAGYRFLETLQQTTQSRSIIAPVH